MKTAFKIILLLSILSCNTHKSFEGKVKYSIVISCTNPKVDSSILVKMFGKEVTLYLKDGNMKWEADDGRALGIYNVKENINYLQVRPDSIYCENGNTLEEKIVTFKRIEQKDTILNNPCNALFIETKVDDMPLSLIFKNRKRLYFFSDNFPIDPLPFKNCNYNNLNKIYSEIKSIPLKLVEEYNGIKITYKVISIEPESINITTFEIDKNIPRRMID